MNSLKKGKRFELEVVKLLNEITNYEWSRTPMSGSFATLKNINSKELVGDVFCKVGNLDIFVECKSRKKQLKIEDLFNEKSEVRRWIKKLDQQSSAWWLFFKYNYSHYIYLIIPKSFYKKTTEIINKKYLQSKLEFDNYFLFCIKK